MGKTKGSGVAEGMRGEEDGPKTLKSSTDTADMGKQSARFLMAA